MDSIKKRIFLCTGTEAYLMNWFAFFSHKFPISLQICTITAAL